MEEKTHIFEKSILKAYDIRGVVGEKVNDADAYFIGKSYGTLLIRMDKKSCVVGYDGRKTSKQFADLVCKGLNETGVDVVNIGLVPTPTVYFGVQHLKKDAGIIITASHNPPEYNGFKMLTNEEPIWGENIQKLGEFARNGDFENGEGKLEYRDIRESYINFILSKLDNKECCYPVCGFIKKIINKITGKGCSCKKNKKLKIVWDAGNGAAASVLKEIVAKIPGEHKTICDVVDANFPIHHPDPSVEKNMEMLKKEVVDGGFDLGFGFDGDGDRIGVVDDKGILLYGDQLLAILAREFLSKNPGEKVMSEVKASKVLYDDIKEHGGEPIMWKPGHSSQKAKMKADNIKLAGETSGHIFYGENHNYDDSLYASIKLINFVLNSDKKLSEIREAFPKTFSTKEIRVNVGDERKFEIPAEIVNRMKENERKFVDVDGVRVETKDGWWLVRASNTEPDITTRCEALSEEGLEECKKDLKEQLNLSNCDIIL